MKHELTGAMAGAFEYAVCWHSARLKAALGYTPSILMFHLQGTHTLLSLDYATN